MFKTVFTLFRGSVAVAEEVLEDRTALLILDQQMRDTAAALDRSKRALALAIAQDQLVDVLHQIVDRAVGDPDLAGEIAGLQARETPPRNRALRRQDQRIPEFFSSFQCLGHSLTKFVSAAQIFLERCSS